MITDFIAALGSSVSFRIAWKRARHIRHGHPIEKSQRLDKLHSYRHPHTDPSYIYTVNVMVCLDCGLTYIDDGLERRAFT